MTRRGWYERKEIQKVTTDWVKMNCGSLTKREIELLQIIHDRKLVRRDHLEVISPSYRYIEKNRTQIINRAIGKLFTKLCIDKVHEEQKIGRGSLPCIVAIDKAGAIVLDVPHRRRITHEKRIIKGETYTFRQLPNYTRHVNGINKVEVDTINICEESGGKILSWRHEYGRSFKWENEKITLIPDVVATIEINGNPFDFYIEYDTGTEDRRGSKKFPTIKKKILKYKAWEQSDLWQKDFNKFPTILFITEDKSNKGSRIKYFNKKCEEMGLDGYGIYHESYTNFFKSLVQMV
ncbi:replication-relaxation family protein [Priestia aryabhattai]|uniref:replication-relaxation family protein n=1 Tax=Priestia aryabhattai TaxID=412384 RepID=UPI0039A3EF9D